MFRAVASSFEDYRHHAHSVAAMHGRQSDCVTIHEHREPSTLYFRVIKEVDGATYAVFTLRPNVGDSVDFGGFTARPGYGGAALDAVLEATDRMGFDLTLDCFDKDGFLPKVYAGRGFAEYAREAYDVEAYGPLKDGSTPDVVYMSRRAFTLV